MSTPRMQKLCMLSLALLLTLGVGAGLFALGRLSSAAVFTGEGPAPSLSPHAGETLALLRGWQRYTPPLSPDEPDGWESLASEAPGERCKGSAYRVIVALDGEERLYALGLPAVRSGVRLWVNGEPLYGPDAAPLPFAATDRIEIIAAFCHEPNPAPVLVLGTPGALLRLDSRLQQARVGGIAAGLACAVLCLLAVAQDRRPPVSALFCAGLVLYLAFPGRPFSFRHILSLLGLYGMPLCAIWRQSRVCGLPAAAPAAASITGVVSFAALLLTAYPDGAEAAYVGAGDSHIVFFLALSGLLLLCGGAFALCSGQRGDRLSMAGLCGYALALLYSTGFVTGTLLPAHLSAGFSGLALALGAGGASCRQIAAALRKNALLYERERTAQGALAATRHSLLLQQSYVDEARRLRHEAKSQLLLLRAYLAHGQYDKLAGHIDAQLGELARTAQTAYTGHSVADAVLAEAQRLAREQGTVLRCQLGGLPENLAMEDGDVAGLLRNILDNALEACALLGDGREASIDLELFYAKGAFAVECRNTCLGEPVQKQGVLPTTKQDPLSHGYGMQIIRDIVKKYDGVLEFGYEDGRFSLYAGFHLGIAKEDGSH